MRRVIVLILFVLAFANLHTITLDKPPKNIDKNYVGKYPQVYVPVKWRQRNWLGPQREGSCTFATLVTILRAQGKFKLAAYVRSHFADGCWPEDMAKKLDKAGIRYAYTSKKGDVKFLEWACKTHRGCGVTVRGASHMVALVHLDKKWAGLIDNNDTDHVIWVPRRTFIAEWLNSESWAVTPVYTPQPPQPIVIK